MKGMVSKSASEWTVAIANKKVIELGQIAQGRKRKLVVCNANFKS